MGLIDFLPIIFVYKTIYKPFCVGSLAFLSFCWIRSLKVVIVENNCISSYRSFKNFIFWNVDDVVSQVLLEKFLLNGREFSDFPTNNTFFSLTFLTGLIKNTFLSYWVKDINTDIIYDVRCTVSISSVNPRWMPSLFILRALLADCSMQHMLVEVPQKQVH